jgi:hypothetical protein
MNKSNINKQKSRCNFEDGRRGNTIELIVKLFAELVLVESVGKGLVELFFVEFVSLIKKILDFNIIIFLPLPVFENPQYLDFSHSVKCKYRVLTCFM